MSTPATPTTTAAAPGVQVLLDAEKEANRQVQLARQFRVQRLKDARAEAHKEIESLKQSKNEEYVAYERAVLGSLEGTVQEYARETQGKLEEIQKVAEAKQDEVVKLLLDVATRVEPKLHENTALRMREGN